MQPAPLISIVLSFRNEEPVIPELIKRLQQVFTQLPVDYELIFVNDASTDNSLQILREKAAQDSHIKIINMSRRFGVAESVLAGMQYARGAAVVYMDTDLQDPPELIPEMIEHWQRGADVVYTVRAQRQGESRLKLWLTKLAYHVINASSTIRLPIEAGDFRLLSRRVVEILLDLPEKNPYLRGLVTWAGFNQVPVYYTRQPRAAGVTHFPILGSRGPLNAFVNGLVSFSQLPLIIFLLLGIFGGLASVVFAAMMIIRSLSGLSVPDWAGVGGILLFAASAQLLGLGTIGLYIGRVLDEVRNRPRFIVKDTVGFDDTPR